MTINELQIRQSWSFNQKLDHAIGTVEAIMARTKKNPFVSYSGGKDSTVLLDLCRRFIDKNMEAVFVNTGNEYPEIVSFVKNTENVIILTPKINIRQMIEKYGFPLVSKEVSGYIYEVKTTNSETLKNIRLNGKKGKNGNLNGKIPNKWQYLIKTPFMISNKCCEILKKKPLEKYQKETNKIPIIGTRAEESQLRKQQYLKRGGCNSYSENKIASYPLSIWLSKDVDTYIEKFNIDLCKLYDNPKCLRTGCMFCGFGAHLETYSRFKNLYDQHPQLYQTIMNYKNNGITYREALKQAKVLLPDEIFELEL